MWNIFEQYGFFKVLLDFNSDKIREAAFWSVVANLIIMVMGIFKFWTGEILGLGAGVALMIFIIMFFDLITGLSAAKYEGECLQSKKGLRWIFKFGSYTVFIYVINMLIKEVGSYGFEWMTYPMNIIKLFVIFTISFWEMKSIDENFERMGFSFGIFKLLDPIYKAFKNTIKKQADIDLDQNDSSAKKPADD